MYVFQSRFYCRQTFVCKRHSFSSLGYYMCLFQNTLKERGWCYVMCCDLRVHYVSGFFSIKHMPLKNSKVLGVSAFVTIDLKIIAILLGRLFKESKLSARENLRKTFNKLVTKYERLHDSLLCVRFLYKGSTWESFSDITYRVV